MSVELTKDSDALICLIYKEYCRRRKDGLSKSDAKYFEGGSREIHTEIAPKLPFEDVDETCRELDRAEMLDCFYADDFAFHVWLSDNGIIYMENRFKNGVSDVIGYLERLKGIVPFL